jgi:hypothetical protein
MTALWDIAPCGPLLYTDVSDVRRSTPRLHSATSKKALIFVLLFLSLVNYSIIMSR